jgi:hypothetical protein
MLLALPSAINPIVSKAAIPATVSGDYRSIKDAASIFFWYLLIAAASTVSPNYARSIAIASASVNRFKNANLLIFVDGVVAATSGSTKLPLIYFQPIPTPIPCSCSVSSGSM